MSFFKNRSPKEVKVAMWIYPKGTKFPEYQCYNLPDEIDTFLGTINSYSEVGYKIKLERTSIEQMHKELKQ